MEPRSYGVGLLLRSVSTPAFQVAFQVQTTKMKRACGDRAEVGGGVRPTEDGYTVGVAPASKRAVRSDTAFRTAKFFNPRGYFSPRVPVLKRIIAPTMHGVRPASCGGAQSA